MDNCENYGEISLEIWRVNEDGAQIEWASSYPSISQAISTLARWDGDDRVVLDIHDRPSLGFPEKHYYAFAEFEPTGWKLTVDRGTMP